MDTETELSTQKRFQTGQSVNFTWSGGTIPVCPPLPVPVTHEAQTLQPNTNLQVILAMNYAPSLPDLTACSEISGVLTKI